MCKRIYKEQTTSNGDIPFYKIGTFGGKPDAFISKALYSDYKEKYPYPKVGDLLISASGTIGRVVEYNGEEAYFQDSNIVWLKHNEQIINSFLKYVYSTVKWKGIEGSTIKRLYNDNFLNTELYIPEISEQHKISEFLSVLDKRIDKQHALVDTLKKYKRGVFEAIFSRKLRLVPKEEQKDWKVFKLNEFASRITRKNNGTTDIPLTISAQYGLIDQRDFFSKVVASADMSGYYLLRKGEYAYNRSTSNEYPFGSIKRLELYNEGAVSTIYLCFSINENIIVSDFAKWYFESSQWYRSVNEICSEGARNHGLLNVPIDGFFNTTHILPIDIKEQMIIATFLSLIQGRLERSQEGLDQLNQLRNGLMQQLFI